MKVDIKVIALLILTLIGLAIGWYPTDTNIVNGERLLSFVVACWSAFLAGWIQGAD